LIVVAEASSCGEGIELWQQVVMVGARTAVQDHDIGPIADDPRMEADTVDVDRVFDHCSP
jgi:hypothetical protein